MATPFDAPIPGQALTDEPGNAPWEKPAQFDDPEEATMFYLNKMADPDIMDDVSVLFENGMTLKSFVETMVQMGAMNGMHTVDVGLLIKPVLVKYFKEAMLTYGIDAKEEALTPDEKSRARSDKRIQTALKLALADAKANNKTAANDPGVQMMEALQKVEAGTATEEMAAPTMEQEQPAAPQGAGLMARGA